MDWKKVVENLREQSNFYAKKANEFSLLSGHYDIVKQMRDAADTASILASAFSAGLASDS